MRVLNVGGQSKDIPLPDIYYGWEQVLLDIEEGVGADIVADARDLFELEEKFDAVYCSHVLEHFHQFEVDDVLQGFKHVLNPLGFVQIRVPDLLYVMKEVVRKHIPLDGKLYNSAAGDITPLDVIYGYQWAIQEGKPYYAHKLGFSKELLHKYLKSNGFMRIDITTDKRELNAIARLV